MPPRNETASPPHRVELGLVSLVVTDGWSFYPLGDRIVGRPADGVGGLQIKRLPLESVAWPATHEACMFAAVAASEQVVQGPGADRAREYGDCCLAGGESFRAASDFVRIWYRHCPDGMLAAWFAVKKNRAKERHVLQSLRQCDHMVATLRVPPPVS
jgi:hypothetical protein